MIEHQHQLVPCQGGVLISQRHGVKAVVPTPDLRHPVLGHIHGRASEMTFGSDNGCPVNIGRQLASIRINDGCRGRRLEPLLEFLNYQALAGREAGI